MTDDFALAGESGGYVPCGGMSATVGLADDAVAIFGEDEGYIPDGTAASALSGDGADDNALAGGSVGFVAKPCCVETVCSATELDHDLFDRTVNTTDATGWQGFGETNTTGLTWRAEGYNEGDPRCDGSDAIMSFTGVGFFGSGACQSWLATGASSSNAARYRIYVASGDFHWKVTNLRVSDADISVLLALTSTPQGWYWYVGSDGDTLTGTPAETWAYYIRVGSEAAGTWSLIQQSPGNDLGDGSIIASGALASGSDVEVEITGGGSTLNLNGSGITLPTPLYEAFVEFDLAGALGHTATSRMGALYHLGPTICEDVAVPCP